MWKKLILRKFLCSAAALAVSLAIVYNSGESLVTCLIGAEVMYLSGYVLLVEILELLRGRKEGIKDDNGTGTHDSGKGVTG